MTPQASPHLTAGQRALLEAELVLRQRQLQQRLAAQHEGLSRVEHARAVLQQDGDDAAQREGERELDLALTDLETRQLDAIGLALRRLDSEAFGFCSDCGTDIPFDRLKVEPWALRCVRCESDHETAARLRT